MRKQHIFFGAKITTNSKFSKGGIRYHATIAESLYLKQNRKITVKEDVSSKLILWFWEVKLKINSKPRRRTILVNFFKPFFSGTGH